MTASCKQISTGKRCPATDDKTFGRGVRYLEKLLACIYLRAVHHARGGNVLMSGGKASSKVAISK